MTDEELVVKYIQLSNNVVKAKSNLYQFCEPFLKGEVKCKHLMVEKVSFAKGGLLKEIERCSFCKKYMEES